MVLFRLIRAEKEAAGGASASVDQIASSQIFICYRHLFVLIDYLISENDRVCKIG